MHLYYLQAAARNYCSWHYAC